MQALQTAHGAWSVREGFIVRVELDGRVGFGEIAPIPWFGTETLEEARAFLERLVKLPELAEDVDALAGLPCCAFGVSAALLDVRSVETLEGTLPEQAELDVAALLPAGTAATGVLLEKLAAGHHTFKWKIGVSSVAEETAIFETLADALPAGGKLRLDANGGLTFAELDAWLDVLLRYLDVVEFMEQPLAVGHESAMAAVMKRTGLPIALDESLNGSEGKAWLKPGRWKGPLVVKPLLMGAMVDLVARLEPIQKQVVLSSVFETVVGRRNTLPLLGALPKIQYALGFDTLDAFEDDLGTGDIWNFMEGYALPCQPNEVGGNENGHGGACPSSCIGGMSGVAFAERLDARKRELSAINTAGGVLLAEADPIEFTVIFFAAIELKVPVILANPNWGEGEWKQLAQLVAPVRSFGVDFKGELPGEDLAEGSILIPTGGTTGGVKLAIHDWDSLSASARAIQAFLGGGAIDSCCLLPLYHVSGLMQLVRSFITGGCIRFDDSNFDGACLSVVPTQLMRMMRDAKSIEKLTTARVIFVGGAAMPSAVVARACELKLPVVPVYGMTETAAMCAAVPNGDFLKQAGLGAVPLGDTQFTIEPDGRIRIKSSALFKGYLGRQVVDRSNGYLTDDVGKLDGDGRLQVFGRVDRLINSGGEKIDPSEVEAAVLKLEGVGECRVVGVPNEEWGERVVAYYVSLDSRELTDWKLALSQRLANFKIPKEMIRVGQLPADPKDKNLGI